MTKRDDKVEALISNVEKVIRGKRRAIELAVTTLIARGHLLIEDVPGVGKTTLAHALARSIDSSFQRIQFTSDLLPSDVLGATVYRAADHAFEFRKGPIFANIVLADEINRATPKTQSALLEAMSDRQVTVDRTTYPLPEPFMLAATQNPMEFSGTFPLPENQIDRFTMRLKIGYPDEADEREIMKARPSADSLAALGPVLSAADVTRLQEEALKVRVDEDLVGFILEAVKATRGDDEIRLGVSPRGAATLYRACQAYAIVRGRNYSTPDDVKALAAPVFGHRIVASGAGADETGRDGDAIIERIVAGLKVPV